MAHRAAAVIHPSELDRLIQSLTGLGYTVVGPKVRDGTIVYDPVHAGSELPVGWFDHQGPGSYRLEQRGDDSHFAFAVGPHSWKTYLHPSQIALFRARREGEACSVQPDGEPAPRYAFLGVRACDLAAIARQDVVLTGGPFVDPVYDARRRGAFIVAVACTQSAATCFCASMGTGPAPAGAYDLALTECGDRLLVDVGSDAGAAVLNGLASEPADQALREEAAALVARAAAQQQRAIDPSATRDLLAREAEHPHWNDVAARCLACGNCTMVCPTCFCTTVDDVTDLTGMEATRERRWDSCFSLNFSYIHGGSVRASLRARYRHWLTHKLTTWYDQFGTSGCVGCGRCITWCPVGIDLTEVVTAIHEAHDHGNAGTPHR